MHEYDLTTHTKSRPFTGIAPDEQVWMYDGQRLHPGSTLAENNIAKESTLHMAVVPRNTISVTVCSHKAAPFSVLVSQNTTIAYIKGSILALAGVDPEEQRLCLEDGVGEAVDLEGFQTLDSYISAKPQLSDVTVWLTISMTVYIQEVTGERHALLVRRWFNLTIIRALVWNVLGAHPDDQRMITFHGRRLADGPTLAEYGVGHRDVLHLLLCIRE